MQSSTLVISYLMKKHQMSFKEAIALVRKARPAVLPNLGFERQLKKFEEELKVSGGGTSFAARKVRLRQLKVDDYGKS